ncbi:ribosomal maturation YjgA family protein [Streptomyces sp. NPDC001070]
MNVRQNAPGTLESRTRDSTAYLVRTRLVAAGAAVITVGAGLGLRAVAEGNIAKYGGDALYTVLLLALVVLVAPRVTPLTTAGSALAVSWGVEFLQLSEVPAELSRRSYVARLVLGSTFNPPDLFGYAIGAAAGWLVHTAVCSFLSRRRAGTPLTP